jgi:hypothetical protein
MTYPNYDSTLLVLAPVGLPPFASRGLHQSLSPISMAKNLRRTVNGALISLAPSQLQLYSSTITCDDMDSPAFDGLWPGTEFTVSCAVELAYLSIGSPSRPVVSGSTRTDSSQPGFTWYRPQLTMLCIDFSVDFDEWGARLGWRMELEELGGS